jgi:spore germination protein
MMTISRRGVRVLASAAVLVTAAAVLVVQQARPGVFPWSRSPLTVAAYMSEWDAPSAASFDKAVEHGMSEVSPVWATVNPDGSVTLAEPPDDQVAALHRRGLRLMPTVQNYADDAWQGEMVSRILSDPTAAAGHTRALVDAAVRGRWGGVDIDYEALPPTSGEVFTSFLSSLRDQLHAHHLQLSVTVPARTGNEAAERVLAYPYELLGRIADEVRVMTYDHSSSGTEPGPVAPLPWVEAVVRYAVDRVPRDKLMLGLAGYGYDWTSGWSDDLGAHEALGIAQDHDVQTHWDSRAASAFFSYDEDEQLHVVWYEDSRSMAAKEKVATAHGLRGVFLWRLGMEDPEAWADASGGAGGDGA